MRLWMAFLTLLPACDPACGFDGPLRSGSDGGSGTPDAAQLDFGSSFVRVHFDTPADVPMVAKNLSTGADIDTNSQAMCDQHNDRKNEFCVVAGKGFVLPAGQVLRAHGSLPLVLLSTETMTLEATSMVDVSSTRMKADIMTESTDSAMHAGEPKIRGNSDVPTLIRIRGISRCGT
jgi:hypothetical protein